MPAKDQNAVALGRKGGKAKVSKGPMAHMTPEQRSERGVAMAAAKAAKRAAAKPQAPAPTP